MDCSPPGSSLCGILQARILEWVAILFSIESARPRDQTSVSCIAGRFLTVWANKEVPKYPLISPVMLIIMHVLFLSSSFCFLLIFLVSVFYVGFPVGSVIKNPPANARDAEDAVLVPGSGRFPGEGNGNPFHYSCLENPMEREAWRATVHGVTKSQTWLSTHTLLCYCYS